MTAARRVPVLEAVLILALGLTLAPHRSSASQQGVFEHLSAADLRLAGAAIQIALEGVRSGELHMWRNDATGNSGAYMPLRTFKIKTGHFCRDYRETAIARRKMATRNLTACRNEDGEWITVER